MPRWLYTLALGILLPFVVVWFAWRGWRNLVYRGSLRERLALGLARRDDRPLWLHAASVGEAQSLAGLVALLTQRDPGQPLLMTVGTSPGLARARALYVDLLRAASPGAGPALTLALAPLDLPGVAHRFLRAHRPHAAVFVETELWPNLIAACAQQQLPLTLVSARMSERSLQRYQRFAAGLMRQTVRAFSSIGTQSELDRERFIALGASPARVQAIGNLKFDFPLPADIARRGAELRAQHAPHSPLWVAGSTHAGEEDICLAAQRALQARARGQSMPVPLLVLAPRRPERFEAVARWLAERRDVDVLLVDQLGVLLDFYAAADVAFVGGSLVPVGGHNLLEPAAMGKPVLTGPHTFNSPQAAALLEAVGALQRVCNESELAEALWGLLTDGAHAQLVGAKAASAVAANQGAALRALSMITALAPVEQPSTSG